jgi:hypothetical protein
MGSRKQQFFYNLCAGRHCKENGPSREAVWKELGFERLSACCSGFLNEAVWTPALLNRILKDMFFPKVLTDSSNNNSGV